MHDRELFEKAFSPLHASPDTLTEVRKTMRNEKKNTPGAGQERRGRHCRRADADHCRGRRHRNAHQSRRISRRQSGRHHPPRLYRRFGCHHAHRRRRQGYRRVCSRYGAHPRRHQTTQRLVGKYLSKLDAEMTVEGNTIRLGTLLIDESGSGMLTYSVENRTA